MLRVRDSLGSWVKRVHPIPFENYYQNKRKTKKTKDTGIEPCQIELQPTELQCHTLNVKDALCN